MGRDQFEKWFWSKILAQVFQRSIPDFTETEFASTVGNQPEGHRGHAAGAGRIYGVRGGKLSTIL